MEFNLRLCYPHIFFHIKSPCRGDKTLTNKGDIDNVSSNDYNTLMINIHPAKRKINKMWHSR